MGILETESTRRTRRKNLKRYILGAVAVTGIIAVAAVAPNVLGAMAKVGILPSRRQREYIASARARLVRQGLLIRNEKGLLRLTGKGEAALRRLTLRTYPLMKPRRWDGKWRLLIFDIPEYRRGTRDSIRRTLISLGFARLQDSVWVYPYDCEDLVVLLKADFKIGKDILYIIADAIENDRALKKYFEL